MDINVLFFDVFADSYELWAKGLHRRVGERLVELLRVEEGIDALDVGCGTGVVANGVARKVGASGQVIGIDASEGMLRRARLSAPANAAYHRVNVDHHLPFRDGSFDLVTFGDCLPYLADPEEALLDAARVLKPGGQIGVSLRMRSLSTTAQDRFFTLLEGLVEAHPLVIPRPPSDRAAFGEKRVITALLERAGFQSVETHGMVTGLRVESAREWVDLMAGAGPRPHALLTTLGPGIRSALELALDEALARLGEEGRQFHEAFTFAIASRIG